MFTTDKLIEEVRNAAAQSASRRSVLGTYMSQDGQASSLVGVGFQRLGILPTPTYGSAQNTLPIAQLLSRLSVPTTAEQRLWLTYVQAQCDRGSTWLRAVDTADTYLRIRKDENRLSV